MIVQENSLVQKLFRIVINWDLYQRLLNGELKKTPKSELEVETADGPMDGILGTYEGGKNKTIVDIEEIGLTCFFTGKTTNQNIDEEVTNALAHEGKHYVQQVNLGNIKDFDKFIFIAGMLIVFLGTLFLGLYSGIKLPHLLNNYFGWNIAGHGLIWLYLAYYLVVFRAIAHIQLKVFRIGLSIACYLSWAERDARKFAEKAKKDKRWDDVVKIE